MRPIAGLTLFTLVACATTGDSGGGADNLPVSGAGPFQPLAPSDAIPISAPFVLSDPASDLDEPTVVPWGRLLAMWVTVKNPAGTRIEHADVTTTLTDGFGPLYPALQADQAWEAGSVSGPSILWSGPGTTEWLLFYSAGGAIGFAVGTDALGHAWRKAPGPALIADGLEEGNVLGPPAAVRVPSREDGSDRAHDRLRVYYPAEGALWAAEAPYAEVLAGGQVSWTRLDGDPTTPARDPFVAASGAPLAAAPLGAAPLAVAPFAVALGRAQARASLTPAGRVRHDLYFTAATGTLPPTTCGFAGSFTGDAFAVSPAPILPAKLSARSPAETPYGNGAVLFYVQAFGGRDAIAAALSP